jgi:hypothetical protein
LVGRVRSVLNVGSDLRLHEKYDMWGNRPVYVILPSGSEDEGKLYKTCARDYGLKGAEVVAEMVLLMGGEMLVQETGMIEEIIADPIMIATEPR